MSSNTSRAMTRRLVESRTALESAAKAVTERANALACLWQYVQALHRRALTTGRMPTLDDVTRIVELTRGLK